MGQLFLLHVGWNVDPLCWSQFPFFAVKVTTDHKHGQPSRRIISMDQFRGYTVAGMFVVNFLGDLKEIPRSSSTTTRSSATPTR